MSSQSRESLVVGGDDGGDGGDLGGVFSLLSGAISSQSRLTFVGSSPGRDRTRPQTLVIDTVEITQVIPLPPSLLSPLPPSLPPSLTSPPSSSGLPPAARHFSTLRCPSNHHEHLLHIALSFLRLPAPALSSSEAPVSNRLPHSASRTAGGGGGGGGGGGTHSSSDSQRKGGCC